MNDELPTVLTAPRQSGKSNWASIVAEYAIIKSSPTIEGVWIDESSGIDPKAWEMLKQAEKPSRDKPQTPADSW